MLIDGMNLFRAKAQRLYIPPWSDNLIHTPVQQRRKIIFPQLKMKELVTVSDSQALSVTVLAEGNPALVYLSGFGSGSRHTMQQAVNAIAATIQVLKVVGRI